MSADIISANREIDARCAAALGKAWTRPTHGRCCTCQDCGWDHDNCQCGYSEDPEMAQLLEDEIERRGLWKPYIVALVDIREPDISFGDLDDAFRTLWILMRSTPEQRARAFLEAVK